MLKEYFGNQIPSFDDINLYFYDKLNIWMNLSWILTFRKDSGEKPIVSQWIEFSDFPIDSIKIWVNGGIALLPSEY